jgi:hypothetical protein
VEANRDIRDRTRSALSGLVQADMDFVAWATVFDDRACGPAETAGGVENTTGLVKQQRKREAVVVNWQKFAIMLPRTRWSML